MKEIPKKMWAEPAPFEKKKTREDTGESDRLAPPHPERSRRGEALSSENRKPGWRSVLHSTWFRLIESVEEDEGSREARFYWVFPYVFTRQPWALVVVVRV